VAPTDDEVGGMFMSKLADFDRSRPGKDVSPNRDVRTTISSEPGTQDLTFALDACLRGVGHLWGMLTRGEYVREDDLG
jgi:hypothetical protein